MPGALTLRFLKKIRKLTAKNTSKAGNLTIFLLLRRQIPKILLHILLTTTSVSLIVTIFYLTNGNN